VSLANLARLALLLGLALAVVFASTVVAWKFQFARELGPPLWGHFYHPLDVLGWARAWGLSAPYRATFLAGVSTALLFLALPLLVVRLVELYGPLRVEDRSKDEGLGTAAQLLATEHIGRRGDGVVLGRSGRKVLRDHGDGHVLIMGPARSGKGTGHVIPTLLGHAGAMLVFDPKHELAAITGRRRAAFGPVHVFDPTDVHSARFNPLLELRRDGHLIGDCQMAAHILTHLGHGGRDDPFWDDAAAALLTAVLLHVCTSDDPSLAQVWRVVQDIKADVLPTSAHPEVQQTFAGHAALESRVRSSINATLLVRLAFLADPLIQAVTAASDFRAGDLQAAERPVTVFLSIPVAHGQRLRPLTRLMLQSLLAPLTHDLRSQRCPALRLGPEPPPMKLVLSSRFGEPAPAPVTLPEIAPPVIAVATAAGVAFGLPWRYSAATPVTCGVAIDVPLNTFVCVSLPLYDDVIDWPGAKMSTQVPKFENDARASVLVVAPTVIACGVRAGDCVQASAFELPAAMAYVTPLAIDDCTD